MCQALLEIMEPEINKIKESVKEEVTRKVTKEVTREVTREVMEQERQKAIRSTIVALRVCGQGDAAIKNAIMEAYNISASEVEEYL